MKKLCKEENLENCEQHKKMLNDAGIECVIKAPAQDLLFSGSCTNNSDHHPEIWLINDTDFDKAWELINPPPPETEDKDEG